MSGPFKDNNNRIYLIIKIRTALIYNLSFDFLVYPLKYKTYNETNLNVYLEFMGKSYETATVIQNNVNIKPATDLLLKGNYVEAHPGL